MKYMQRSKGQMFFNVKWMSQTCQNSGREELRMTHHSPVLRQKSNRRQCDADVIYLS